VAEVKTIVFLYGTLKRGLRNHFLVADEEFRGEVVTEPHYRVIDLGPYPGLIADMADGLAVRGELWAVSERCLERLDEFEGVPGLFTRESVSIVGQTEEVFAYFWNRSIPPDVPSGDNWPLAISPRE
jgi:gamma-glutamylaminecyclotransferase